METLKAVKKRGDYLHHLIKRNDRVAMYDVTIFPDGEIIGYEVFIIRQQKESTKTIFGVEKHFAETERFPSNEEFGFDAYSPSTRDRADELFEILTGKIEMKNRGISLN